MQLLSVEFVFCPFIIPDAGRVAPISACVFYSAFLTTKREPRGVASLALGLVLHWAFIDIIGCGSAIQASLIAFALHDDSARPY